MKSTCNFFSNLLFFVLVVNQFHAGEAFNFGALDTPLLDSLSNFFCNQREGPLCAMLGILSDEEAEAAETSESDVERTTLGQFLFSVTCNAGLVPNRLCGALGADTPTEAVDDKEEEAAQAVAVSSVVSATDTDRKIVDGFLLSLLCGEDGYAPDDVCGAIVGADGDSGLIRTFCESGVVSATRLCGLVGIETPQSGETGEEGDGDNGGRRMLRHFRR